MNEAAEPISAIMGMVIMCAIRVYEPIGAEQGCRQFPSERKYPSQQECMVDMTEARRVLEDLSRDNGWQIVGSSVLCSHEAYVHGSPT